MSLKNLLESLDKISEASYVKTTSAGREVTIDGKKATVLGQVPTQQGQAKYYAIRFNDKQYPGDTHDQVHSNRIFDQLRETEECSECHATPCKCVKEEKQEIGRRIHRGSYGTEYQGDSDDEDDDGKKKSKPEVKRGRGRPKKGSDSSTGEVKKWDTDTLASWIIGNKPKTLPKGVSTTKHKLKDWMERVEATVLAESIVAEGGVKAIAELIDMVKDGELDIYDVLSGRYAPTSKAEEVFQKQLQRKYDEIAAERGLHPDDDFEKIQDILIDEIDNVLSEEGVSIEPAKTTAHVIKQDNKVIGQVDNPQLANTIKQAIGQGQMTLAGSDLNEGPGKADVPAALRKARGDDRLSVKDVLGSKGNLSDRRTLAKLAGDDSSEKYPKEFEKYDEAVDAQEVTRHSMKDLIQTLDEYSRTGERVEPTLGNAERTSGTRSDGSARIEPRYTGPKIKSAPLSRSSDSDSFRSSRPRYMEEDDTGEHSPITGDEVTTTPKPMKAMYPAGKENKMKSYDVVSDTVSKKQMYEGKKAKPDFLDMDRDGDRNEPMKKAAKDKNNAKDAFKKQMGGSAKELTKGLSIKEEQIQEGKFGQMDADLTDMTPAEFKKEYGMTKAEAREKHGGQKNSKKSSSKDHEKDAQMETWDRQLSGMLMESITINTSTGTDPQTKSVNISATEDDVDQLLAMLQNAGLHAGATTGGYQAVEYSNEQPMCEETTEADFTIPESKEEHSEEVAESDTPIMAMPRGMGVSKHVEANEAEVIETATPEEVIGELDSSDDNGDGVMDFIKKVMNHGAKKYDNCESSDQSGIPASTSMGPISGEMGEKNVAEGDVEEGIGKKIAHGIGKAVKKVAPNWVEKQVKADDERQTKAKKAAVDKFTSIAQRDTKKVDEDRTEEKDQDGKVIRWKEEVDGKKYPVNEDGEYWAEDEEKDKKSWREETPWTKSNPKKNPEGKVHNLAGQALKKTAEKAKKSETNEGYEDGNLAAMRSDDEIQDADAEAYRGGADTTNRDPNLQVSESYDSPAANAVTRRIMIQHPELLQKYGPDQVMQMIDSVTSDLRLGPDDEIGSSDVSGWVRQVIDSLKDVGDMNETKHETCNECGGMYEGEGHECHESLNEWANSPMGQSEDEEFQTEMEFMTKVISGGLNNMKQDQTTLPITRVRTGSESAPRGADMSIGAELKRLAGIN
jgi:hypothetical protein